MAADVRELLTKLVLDWAGAAIGGGARAESTAARRGARCILAT
jgi:2-methylcitrate dehydratase PrpD